MFRRLRLIQHYNCILLCIFHLVQKGEKKWRDDFKCGKDNPLSNGKPTECDPKGKYPCCSGKWCGNTDAHCKCENCVDYRIGKLFPHIETLYIKDKKSASQVKCLRQNEDIHISTASNISIIQEL